MRTKSFTFNFSSTWTATCGALRVNDKEKVRRNHFPDDIVNPGLFIEKLFRLHFLHILDPTPGSAAVIFSGT